MSIPVESSKLLVATGGALGAVVYGVDASAPLPAETILAINQGLLDHHILILQRQDPMVPLLGTNVFSNVNLTLASPADRV